jgi:MSHA biogenesis protein MshO
MIGRRQNGFSLMEMVMVMVILGILAGVLVPMFMESMSAYDDTKQRARLVGKGRLALERIAREVRHAVPNSLSTVGGGTGIEFLRARAGGRYVEHKDNYGTAFSSIPRRFQKNTNKTELYKIGTGLSLAAGDMLVIGNTSPSDLAVGSPSSIVALTSIGSTTLAADGTTSGQVLQFGANRFPYDSPGKHFFIADDVVEVGLSGSTLYWHEGTFSSSLYDQSQDWNVTDPVLVEDVSNIAFRYTPGNTASTGLLQIELSLDFGDETIDLYHEVHIRNTP